MCLKMTQKGRAEDGRYESEHGVTPDQVLEQMEHLEPYTTSELAEATGAPRRTVYNYLEELAENDKIRKKKPNERQAIWIRGA